MPAAKRLIRIDGYAMDLAISESFLFPGEVTKFPAEAGPDTSDHIRDLPPEIELECIVSDIPSGEVAGDASRQTDPVTGDSPLPSEDALQKLLDMKARRRPVTIETSLGTFTSMACEEIEVTRDKDRNNALFFKAKFCKFVTITNRRERVRVRTDMPTGKPKAKAAPAAELRIDRRIIWRHGDPPGSTKLVEISEVIVQDDSNTARLTPKERAVFARDFIGNPMVSYFEARDGEIQRIFGDRYRALIRDLIRDAQFSRKLENRKPGAPAGAHMDRIDLSKGDGTGLGIIGVF